MKKAIAALCGVTVVLGSAMFTACGDDDGKETDRSEKITTATAWSDAFDFSDTTNATLCLDGWEGGRIIYYYFDGNKFKRVMEYPDGKTETRYTEYRKDEDMPGETYAGRGTEYNYLFDEQSEKWNVNKSAIYDMDTLQSEFKYVNRITEVYDESAGESTGKLSERFSDFTYDEKTYSYVAAYDVLGDYTDVSVSIKFKNKKAYSGSGAFTYDDESGTVNASVGFKVFDVGTTKVTLPEVSA